MSAKRKNSLTRQVRRAYRQDELAQILTMPERDFGTAFGLETTEVERHVSPDTYQLAGYQPAWYRDSSYYHFRDNGSKVLAVAHLDTVVDADRRAANFRNTQTGPLVVSGSLDDRLGAYVILQVLPKLGISCDQLLTVGEEDGESTAQFFEPEKDYDWVIEFDRGGTDVVMYQYEDAPTCDLVRASGARVGQGSFSDIAYLEHLGVKSFNWGAGYGGNYHSEKGYAFLADTFASTARYLRFHDQNAGSRLAHEPVFWHGSARPGSGSSLWLGDDAKWDEAGGSAGTCWWCTGESVSLDTGYCEDCGACQDCGEFTDACLCYSRHALSGTPVAQGEADLAS